MKLWSGLLSNNAAKVRIVLAEKQIPHEIIEVPWTKEKQWEPKPAELWQINPRGQVPVLIDEEVTLFDSTIINEYLEEKHPEPNLFPTQMESRAICRLWEDQGDFYQAYIGTLISEVFLAPPGTDLNESARNAMKALANYFQLLEKQLTGQDYLCGKYSVADISNFLTVAFAITLGVDIQTPELKAWYERVLARPVVAKEFGAIMTGVAAL